jgi:hypothetical protein
MHICTAKRKLAVREVESRHVQSCATHITTVFPSVTRYVSPNQQVTRTWDQLNVSGCLTEESHLFCYVPSLPFSVTSRRHTRTSVRSSPNAAVSSFQEIPLVFFIVLSSLDIKDDLTLVIALYWHERSWCSKERKWSTWGPGVVGPTVATFGVFLPYLRFNELKTYEHTRESNDAMGSNHEAEWLWRQNISWLRKNAHRIWLRSLEGWRIGTQTRKSILELWGFN